MPVDVCVLLQTDVVMRSSGRRVRHSAWRQPRGEAGVSRNGHSHVASSGASRERLPGVRGLVGRTAREALMRYQTACIDCGRPGHGTRCPRHEREHMQARGPTGWARQAKNNPILVAEPWCRICKVVRSSEVDHIKPRPPGKRTPEWWDQPQNKQAICGPCHRAKTAREARMRQGGRR